MNRRRFLALFGIAAAKPKLLIPQPTRYTPVSQVSAPLPLISTIGEWADYPDPTLEQLAKEMAYRAGVTIDRIVAEGML